ncbi:MAG: EamA family transporter [Candidatus Aminicenantes bacterium]|nr:EamA family transporter [Candidatus Aminicenantes bacterium]NIM79885.1 EamA family transporter [Candidatus Aminicenantes bacterium]NIN43127.1 EamA family transporter [Candidatus Aminicenantes bacterium]NIN85864.1 EamA family transporter [Candidatus Aminicenantes bacterium]NIO82126.1 EamA family transporter [Candidatus Aminicenantes bacterium]
MNIYHSDDSTKPPGTFILISALLIHHLLGALTFPIAKYGLAIIEPFTFAFYRYGLSSIVLLGIVRFRKANKPPIEKKDYLKIVGLGCLIIPFNQTAYLFGQSLTGAGHGALLFATVPIWLFLGALIYLKEKFILRRAVGVALGLAGVAVIITTGAVELGTQYLVGDLIILIAVFAWVTYTILGRPLVFKYGAFRVTAYTLASGSALYFPFGLYRALIFDYTAAAFGAWLTVIYVALGVSVTAYVLWYWVIKYLEATRVAVFHNLQPVIASVIAFIFLGEPIGWAFIIGGAVVLTGVIITEI